MLSVCLQLGHDPRVLGSALCQGSLLNPLLLLPLPLPLLLLNPLHQINNFSIHAAKARTPVLVLIMIITLRTEASVSELHGKGLLLALKS